MVAQIDLICSDIAMGDGMGNKAFSLVDKPRLYLVLFG